MIHVYSWCQQLSHDLANCKLLVGIRVRADAETIAYILAIKTELESFSVETLRGNINCFFVGI